MSVTALKRITDPIKEMRDAIGDISKVEIFNNQVLCQVFIRPDKSDGGIIIPEMARNEDRYQSKVGLVLKMGPLAFFDPDEKWKWPEIHENNWIYFRPSDGWSITVNKQLCRVLDDNLIKGRIDHPDRVW